MAENVLKKLVMRFWSEREDRRIGVGIFDDAATVSPHSSAEIVTSHLGRPLTVATSRYEVSGQIRAVGGDNSLAHEVTTVVLRDNRACADA